MAQVAISNYTATVVGLPAADATAAPTPPATIIQYVPCVAHRDRTEARQTVKATIGELLLDERRVCAQL